MEPTMEAGYASTVGMKVMPGPMVQIDEGRIQAHLECQLAVATKPSSDRRS